MDEPNYGDVLSAFDAIVSAGTAVSQGAAGREPETCRHYYASLLFTRLCGTSVSLLLLLPRNRFTTSMFEQWDFSAVAGLSRNIAECYLPFYYFCVDGLEDDEWNCRLKVFNLHDCVSRLKMFRELGSDEVTCQAFETEADALRDRLVKNSFFLQMPNNIRKQILKGNRAFICAKEQLLKRIGLDIGQFRGLYRLLSQQTHSLPMSFYRMEEHQSGRGLENDVERRHICLTIDFVGSLLRRAINDMIRLFPGADAAVSVRGRKAIFEE